MRLSHVTLPVLEIARSRQFYRDFGLSLIVDAPHYCRFHARIGAVGDGRETLSIHQAEGPIATAAEIGFEFETPEALDRHATALRALGVAVSEPVDQAWLWREARLRDPDGHALLLLYAGKNKLDPPWRVHEA